MLNARNDIIVPILDKKGFPVTNKPKSLFSNIFNYRFQGRARALLSYIRLNIKRILSKRFLASSIFFFLSIDSGEGVLNTCLTISNASLPERVGVA